MSDTAIFTPPKPFLNAHIGLIQRNAIQSWLNMKGAPKIFLVGDEEGVEQAAAEAGVGYIPDVDRNHLGTPLVSSIIQRVKESSDAEILIYTNADILFPPGMLQTVTSLQDRFDRFLGVGYRWDINLEERLDYSTQSPDAAYERLLANAVKNRSVAIDYFIFPRHLYSAVPDFAVGRSGWDNWMLFHAVSSGWPVIDISPEVKVIHQNHDYHHLPEGRPHYRLEESTQNIELAGGADHMYSLLDLKLEYRGGRVRWKRFSWKRFFRRMERLIAASPENKIRWRLSRVIRKFWVRLELKERQAAER